MSLLSKANAAVWERSRVRQLYRNTLIRVFRTTITFQMLWNEISLLLVKLFPLIVQSHINFFNALGGIYSQNAFPSPIIHINPFSHKSKPPQASVKKISPKLRYFYSKCGVSITRFSCDTSKRALKQDDGNIAIVFILEVNICQYTGD